MRVTIGEFKAEGGALGTVARFDLFAGFDLFTEIDLLAGFDLFAGINDLEG